MATEGYEGAGRPFFLLAEEGMEADDLLCSRNARPEKDEREQATILLVRRAPTIKQWSLDARSEGQFAYAL